MAGGLNKAVALPQAVAEPFVEEAVDTPAKVETGAIDASSTGEIGGESGVMPQMRSHHLGQQGVVVHPNA